MNALSNSTPADAQASGSDSGRLVARIRAGDASAESELVARFSRGVRFLLLELARDASLADDLHQETFRVLLPKLRAGDLRDPDRLPGFVRALARNLFLAHLRRRRQQRLEPLTDAAAPPDPAPSALDSVLRAEHARAVRVLLAELTTPRERAVLLGLYVTGQPKARLCAELGVSAAHLNTIVHRARLRLRALVQRQRDTAPTTGRVRS